MIRRMVALSVALVLAAGSSDASWATRSQSTDVPSIGRGEYHYAGSRASGVSNCEPVWLEPLKLGTGWGCYQEYGDRLMISIRTRDETDIGIIFRVGKKRSKYFRKGVCHSNHYRDNEAFYYCDLNFLEDTPLRITMGICRRNGRRDCKSPAQFNHRGDEYRLKA